MFTIGDERIRRIAASEPRAAWGLASKLSEWAPKRMLPSEAASLLQLQCLAIHHGAKTLECGAGRGWMTSLLIAMGARLCAVEPNIDAWRDLSARTSDDVPLCRGSILEGWPEASPFDRICLTEITREPPSKLREQLTEDGRLVYWITEGNGIALWLDIREGRGIRRERLAFVSVEGGEEEIEALPRT